MQLLGIKARIYRDLILFSRVFKKVIRAFIEYKNYPTTSKTRNRKSLFGVFGLKKTKNQPKS